MKRNKKILNVRPLGYTPKLYRKCLQSLKYSHFNISSIYSTDLLYLIRHDKNLIIYQILSFFNQIQKKRKSLEPCVFKCFSDSFLVAGEGLEPTTSGLWARQATNCSTPRYKKRTYSWTIPWCRRPGSNRYGRNDHRILSPTCLPIPPRRQKMAPRVGLEPTTYRLTAGCSTIELSRHRQTLFSSDFDII